MMFPFTFKRLCAQSRAFKETNKLSLIEKSVQDALATKERPQQSTVVTHS